MATQCGQCADSVQTVWSALPRQLHCNGLPVGLDRHQHCLRVHCRVGEAAVLGLQCSARAVGSSSCRGWRDRPAVQCVCTAVCGRRRCAETAGRCQGLRGARWVAVGRCVHGRGHLVWAGTDLTGPSGPGEMVDDDRCLRVLPVSRGGHTREADTPQGGVSRSGCCQGVRHEQAG